VSNPLALNAAEIDAIRALQGGSIDPATDDPIWDGLEDLGLVNLRETVGGAGTAPPPRVATLTPAGHDYPTP
jgi:hypothetical protein